MLEIKIWEKYLVTSSVILLPRNANLRVKFSFLTGSLNDKMTRFDFSVFLGIKIPETNSVNFKRNTSILKNSQTFVNLTL